MPSSGETSYSNHSMVNFDFDDCFILSFSLIYEFLFTYCSMEFLSRSSAGDTPLVAFGASDGVIRVLSMITWKVCNFIVKSKL